MAKEKYRLPQCLLGQVAASAYRKWLHRKAMAHVRRDRKRGNKSAAIADYKAAIHLAVEESCGVDAYTGEPLDWSLISRFDNESAKAQGRKYKQRFGSLPTIDHSGDGTGAPSFKICSWRTNDAKSDLTLTDFLLLCQRVLEHQGYEVLPTGKHPCPSESLQ